MAMNKAQRRSWLTGRTTLLTNLDRLYNVLSVNKRKGRFCALHDLDFHKVDLDGPGVYFCFEMGERRRDGQPRVVRVGIADSQTLYDRLDNHRTSTQISTFASLVYGAMAYRNGLDADLARRFSVSHDDFYDYLDLNYTDILRRAGQNGNAIVTEMRDFEVKSVLPYMRELIVTWIEVADPAFRTRAEEEATTILSNYWRGAASIDAPCPKWLGRRSHKPEVQLSAQWSSEYVDKCSTLTPGWLDYLEKLV
jgi:hypothetical protein